MIAERLDPSEVFVPCPEGRLRVLVAGAAGSPVLLLSGAGVDNAMLSWRHLIPVLAQHHRVYALDWPKQGGSRPWHGHAGVARMLQCITDTLDHFAVGRADLVGLSQGGALSLAYAIAEPGRVRSVVALAPAGILSFPPVVHQLLWLTAKLSPLVSWVSTMVYRHRTMVARLARHALFAGPVDDFDDIVDEVHAEVLANGARASDMQNDSIGFFTMNLDLRPRLHEIACPTLFIQGDRDIAVKAEHTIDAARRVPNARLEILPGNGHWSNRQSPELVNRLIDDFLANEPPANSP
ncbi:alpha/beta fold hydrolase [Mycobacterium seoulense]|uniref:Magnesium chelatase n=1 Tax=Mycobacterium seoulense TaxID=386911 RepID=A0A7I7P3D7_9MYCO|nr:alpha/beta fold hydrolase [Mycobacterium seoulense]MCV7437262.1 alpha/beta fold hydrolase [Mycobacterium seoulense]BBY02268.1 magnesium chelatase [Mycobacterium seoulense]